MTDKKTLTNQSIKLMWSKCDTDRDGYLDFEEFKEMLLRSRARKELEKLEEEEEGLGTSELEMLRMEEEGRRVKNLYKVAEVEDKDSDTEEEIQEDIVEIYDRMIVVEPPLEDDIDEDLDFEQEESAKV